VNRPDFSMRDLRTKQFKEFNSKDKEKIASLIDYKKDEMILSRAVEDYIYATTRALDAGDYFNTAQKSGLWEQAVNRNHDYFDMTELDEIHPDKKIARYLTFRTAGMYKNHESDKIENSIGLVFDSVFIKEPYDDMHVTTLFGIDTIKAPNITRDLVKYPTRVPVSMGCSITHSMCTSCGKNVFTEADICECLKYARGRRKNGRKVAELLRGVDFFELSVVSSPAAPKAYVIDAVSDLIPGRLLKVAGDSNNYNILEIMSGIYDMIKMASTPEEKRRLSLHLDNAISKLESFV
jgi:hypothetical protein